MQIKWQSASQLCSRGRAPGRPLSTEIVIDQGLHLLWFEIHLHLHTKATSPTDWLLPDNNSPVGGGGRVVGVDPEKLYCWPILTQRLLDGFTKTSWGHMPSRMLPSYPLSLSPSLRVRLSPQWQCWMSPEPYASGNSNSSEIYSLPFCALGNISLQRITLPLWLRWDLWMTLSLVCLWKGQI